MKNIKETGKDDFNDNEVDCEESKPYDFNSLKNDFEDFNQRSIWFKLSFLAIIGVGIYTVVYLTVAFAGSNGSTISFIIGFILALIIAVVAVIILMPIIPMILWSVIAITTVNKILYCKINREIK